MNWRKYFDYLGFTQECEKESPGYTLGLICVLAVMLMALPWLVYAVCWKIH